MVELRKIAGQNVAQNVGRSQSTTNAENTPPIFDVKNGTYAQLRKCVASTKDMDVLPRPEKLKASDEPILFRESVGNAVITVYCNGLVLYRAQGCATVFAVDRCYLTTSVLVEEDGELIECTQTIDESHYMDSHWTIPIEATGERRIEHNLCQRYNGRVAYHIDSLEGNRSVSCVDVTMFDDVENDDDYRQRRIKAIRCAIDELTERQSRIVDLYYKQGKTEKEISAILGIQISTVSDHIKAIKKKFVKICGIYIR